MNDFRIKDLTTIRCISIVSLILLKSNFHAYAAPSSNIQTDSDLVFEEGDIQASHINSKPINSVPVNEVLSVNIHDEPAPPGDNFFDKTIHHYNRIKRGLFDLINPFATNPESSNKELSDSSSTSSFPTTAAAGETYSSPQKRDTIAPSKSSIRTTRQTEPQINAVNPESQEDDSKNGEGDDDDDGGDDESTIEPYSGDSSTSTIQSSSDIKRFFRVFITLLVPYSNEMADPKGTIFDEYNRNISWAIEDIFKAPDFASSHLIHIINTADPSTSKAIIDLEFYGSENNENIEEAFINHLNSKRSLKSLPAASEGFYLRYFSEGEPYVCPDTEIPCRDSDACYSTYGRCNGINECPDKSDELDCPIPGIDDRCKADDKFRCGDKRTIICATQRCDEVADCPGGDDEFNCAKVPTGCLANEFTCGNGVCIPLYARCNRRYDCDDASDEEGCSSSSTPAVLVCTNEEFSCDGRCFPSRKKCDKIKDCSNGSDEENCPFGRPGEITDRPNIIVTIRDPIVQIVSLGSTVRYTCEAKSIYEKPVSIRWSKEGRNLPAGRVVDDGLGYLVILTATASDSGTYVCTAFDGQSYVSKNVRLVVGDTATPKVSLVPSGVIQLNAGESFSLNCEATGFPQPKVEIGRSDGSSVNKQTALRSTVLTISSIKKSDEGTYYCKAGNVAGADEQRITIYVNDNTYPTQPPPREVHALIQPSEFYGAVGKTIRLECIASPSGNARIRWTRYPNENLPSKAVVTNNILTIPDASESDTAVYICSVISDLNGAPVAQSNVTVNIGRRGPKPLLIVEPERQDVAQGSTAVIRCTPTDPTTRVTWRKVNDGLPEYAQIIGNELRIPSVQVKDRGVYVCRSTNEYGDIAEISAILEVERREPPSVEIYPKERQVVLEGSSALIQCRVSRGEPSPTLHWSRAGNRSLSSNVLEVEGVLRFIDVSESDAGEYICTAENLAGLVSAVAVLQVTSQPIITIFPSGPIKVNAGNPVELRCSARGRPTPSVQWIPPSSYQYGSPSALVPEPYAVYTITAAQARDEGIYTCVAVNSAGRKEERVQLSVIEDKDISRPGVVPSVAPIIEVVFPTGTTAKLRCRIEGNVPQSVNIHWSREDSELPLYHVIRGDKLQLFKIDRSHSGKYTCTVLGRSNEPLFSNSMYLRVVDPPQITLDPVLQIVRPGDNAYINCSAQGEAPITIEWVTRTYGELPRSVIVDQGLLQFRSITVYDAGRYVCMARNIAGDAHAVAEVIVNDSQTSSPWNEFICKDGTPVGNETICDGERDCPDGSDEESCDSQKSSSSNKFKCKDGTLVRNETICDGQRDCPDGSDEESCGSQTSCGSSSFLCKDGLSCASNELKCDGNEDCPDGSDEENCDSEAPSSSNEFICKDGTLFGNKTICDGRRDCPDGSDEESCDYAEFFQNVIMDSI